MFEFCFLLLSFVLYLGFYWRVFLLVIMYLKVVTLSGISIKYVSLSF